MSAGMYRVTKSRSYENKSLILVKFVDAAQRDLQNFLQTRLSSRRNKKHNNVNGSEGVQIDFSSGEISIPTCNGRSSYKFNNAPCPPVYHECMRQIGDTFSNVGPFKEKLAVLPNEDIYESTKEQMVKIFSMEQMRGKPVRIDSNDKGIGSVVRMQRSNGWEKRRSRSFPDKDERKTLEDVLVKRRRLMIGDGNKDKGAGDRNWTGKALDEVTRRPMRERILHMLAVKSYGKEELVGSVHREGVRDYDKFRVVTILKSLSFQDRDLYHLRPELWEEVNEDWSFYTKADKRIVKANKEKFRSNPRPTNSATFENSTATALPEKEQKSGWVRGADGFQTKHRRISRYSTPAERGKEEKEVVETKKKKEKEMETAERDVSQVVVVRKSPRISEATKGGKVSDDGKGKDEAAAEGKNKKSEKAASKGIEKDGGNRRSSRRISERLTEGSDRASHLKFLKDIFDTYDIRWSRESVVNVLREYRVIEDVEQYRKYRRDARELLKEHAALVAKFDGALTLRHGKAVIAEDFFQTRNYLKRTQKIDETSWKRFEYVYVVLELIKRLIREYEDSERNS